ncbi:MAG: hypothetical protein IKF29_07125 [Oceanobacillus sp.]|nr:hypothetical protein [Oceanobacillus sp.]
MNKEQTKDKIELMIYKKIVDDLAFLIGFNDVDVAAYYRQAERELKDTVFLTKNQIENLEDKLTFLYSVTNHNYLSISFHEEPVEHARLYFEENHLDKDGELVKVEKYDSICGKFVSWQIGTFDYDKRYYIDGLLGEE